MINPDEAKDKNEIKVSHALERYKNHCEFLGYSVREDDEISILCTHSRKGTLRLILLNFGVGVMAQIVFGIPERALLNPLKLYTYANELNHAFTFTKACIGGVDENKPYVVFSSVLEGDYDRKNFAIFLDNIDHDMNIFHSHPRTNEIWQAEQTDELEF